MLQHHIALLALLALQEVIEKKEDFLKVII